MAASTQSTMRIALFGRAESGKTRVADHLAKRFTVHNIYDLQEALSDPAEGRLNLYHTCDFTESKALLAVGWVALCVCWDGVKLSQGRGMYGLDGKPSDPTYYDNLDAFVDLVMEMRRDGTNKE